MKAQQTTLRPFVSQLKNFMLFGLMLGAALYAAADLQNDWRCNRDYNSLDPRFQIETGNAHTDTTRCAANMLRVWQGMMAYAQDNDEKLPIGPHPINDLTPRYVGRQFLRCPKAEAGQQSYGLVSMCTGYKMSIAPFAILVPALVESDVELMEPEQALSHLRFAHTEYVIGVPNDRAKSVTIDPNAPPGTVYQIPVQEVPLVPYTKSLGTIIFSLDGHYSMDHPDFVAKYEMTDTPDSMGTFSRSAIKRRLGQ